MASTCHAAVTIEFVCNSYQRGQPFQFNLGEGEVIKGVDMGMMNMCEGERRRLTLPAHLGYGKRGSGKTASRVL